MEEHKHNDLGECACHDHHHDHGHDDKDDGPIIGGPMSNAHTDTAAKSLSDALRWSFAILTVIMILVVVGFMLTGVKRIQAQEVGVKKVFGRIVGTVEPGLAYTWPFPIGEIEKVSTKQQMIEVDDLWMNESGADKAQPNLSQRAIPEGGLRPGWDGALFTGDRILIHVKLVCFYVVNNAKDYKMNIPEAYEFENPYTGRSMTIDPARTIVRTALVSAAIHAASQRAADNIQKNQGVFLDDVKMLAQQHLNQLQSGIKIDNVNFASPGISWPLQALGAYDRAQAAASTKETLISQALNEAKSILIATAGSNYALLVGEPSVRLGTATSAPSIEGEDYDLIGQYSAARTQADQAKAAAMLAKIDDVLVSRSTEGTRAGQTIKTAVNYATTAKLTLESRARQFERIKGEYLKNPQFMMDSLWTQAKEDILSQPTVLKFYVSDNGVNNPTVIKINHDQDFLKQLRNYLLESSPAGQPNQGRPAGAP
jgi:regulator of protease activity HflC (stomatin/prohibitin superfamily)